MAEILGIGLSHYPGFYMKEDADMSVFLKEVLRGGKVPLEMRDPANWPDQMRREWAFDQGAGAGAEHRRRAIAAFRTLRTKLDKFAPDLVLIWGDDQYENFVEDVVPPFCVYILDRIESLPHDHEEAFMPRTNVWGEASDTSFTHRGHARAARFLANDLSRQGLDLAYSYRLRYRRGLAHAFIISLLYLDFDRKGFDFPIIPFHVNCYGGDLIRRRGGVSLVEGSEADPPAPSAKSCFNVGRAVARAFRNSDLRVALIASSSWSHAFLTEKHYGLFPDHISDRRRLSELEGNRFDQWRDLDRPAIEAAGQHELMNWICLAGAMTEMGAKVEIVNYLETYVLNSNKCFAIFRS